MTGEPIEPITPALELTREHYWLDLRRRVHGVIFSLLYPAFLGTFIFAIFERSWDLRTPPWAPLFAVYFAVQYMEGVSDPKRKSGRDLAFAIVEAGLMLMLFRQLGFLVPNAPATPDLQSWITRGLAAATFALPVVARWKRGEKMNPFNSSLTGLSLVAAISVSISFGYIVFFLVLALLAIYLVAFQLFNPLLPTCLRRPLAAEG